MIIIFQMRDIYLNGTFVCALEITIASTNSGESRKGEVMQTTVECQQHELVVYCTGASWIS